MKKSYILSPSLIRTTGACTMFFLILLLSACSKKRNHTIQSPDDIRGAVIGVQLGTTGDVEASKFEGDKAGTLIERYTKTADAIQALTQGKIDCVIDDEQPSLAFVSQNNNIKILPQKFHKENFAFCFAKDNEELRNKVNYAIDKLRKNGIIDSIENLHIHKNITRAYQKKNIKRNNGTLVIATNATYKPYEYYDNGNIVGIDIDIMQAICDILGMNMDIEDMNFDAVITSVQTGKADIGASGITVTPDRKKNILFSHPYTSCNLVVTVRQGVIKTQHTSLVQKFKDNFITEHRYRYLLEGLGNTLIITVFAILISLVLGTLIAIVRTTHDSNGNYRLLNLLCKFYLTIIRGTPTMVQLLIIYYVVFAAADISKVFVAIVAFGLNSSAYLAEVVRSGISSIDKGQMEAGRSLGLSYAQTMRLVILPQAFKNVLPAIGNELITLLKETSISGYIGLVDLTKGSDIIRSITYDAIMPLTFVALIYLTIVMGLSAGVSHLEKKLNKHER